MTNDKSEKQMKYKSPMRESWGRLIHRPAGAISFAIILFIICIAVFANLIVPYDEAISQAGATKYLAPCAGHIFGCDQYGRDLFARIVYGTRVDLFMSLTASVCGVFLGTILGCACAYFGGKVDMVVMRIVEIISSIPGLVLALAICAGIGSGMWQLIVALTASTVPLHIRMVRSSAITVSGIDYVEAAVAQGSGVGRIIFKHYLPNVLSIVILQFTQCCSVCITVGATLSFIGLGVKSPTPEWGIILSEGVEYMQVCPWLAIVPGVFIVVTALAISTFGDCLRDAFDPKLKTRMSRRKRAK